MPFRFIDGRRLMEARSGEWIPTVCNKVASASALVAGGNTFATVTECTPTADITILGYSADFQAILATNYRLRLITGTDLLPTVLHEEVVSTTANAWMPVKVDIPTGTRVAVQIAHGETLPQNAEATINYEV